jgi:hypothetical protein
MKKGTALFVFVLCVAGVVLVGLRGTNPTGIVSVTYIDSVDVLDANNNEIAKNKKDVKQLVLAYKTNGTDANGEAVMQYVFNCKVGPDNVTNPTQIKWTLDCAKNEGYFATPMATSGSSSMSEETNPPSRVGSVVFNLKDRIASRDKYNPGTTGYFLPVLTCQADDNGPLVNGAVPSDEIQLVITF